ncbi:hypothetical protein QQ045_031639 [Rhodiola kirilowii]
MEESTENLNQIEVLSNKFKGKVVVSIRKDVKEEALKEYKWALVLKLVTGKNFHVTALANNLKKAWNMFTGLAFEEISGNMAVVRFEQQEDMEWVLEGGPWLFAKNQVVLMKKWEIGRRPELLDFTKIEVWVQIHNLPLEIMKDYSQRLRIDGWKDMQKGQGGLRCFEEKIYEI